MVSNKSLESAKARRVRIRVSRRKHLRIVAVTALVYRLLSKAVLVTL